MSPEDDVFLNRLYAAFDVDNNKQIDFRYALLYRSLVKMTYERSLTIGLKTSATQRICGWTERLYERNAR